MFYNPDIVVIKYSATSFQLMISSAGSFSSLEKISSCFSSVSVCSKTGFPPTDFSGIFKSKRWEMHEMKYLQLLLQQECIESLFWVCTWVLRITHKLNEFLKEFQQPFQRIFTLRLCYFSACVAEFIAVCRIIFPGRLSLSRFLFALPAAFFFFSKELLEEVLVLFGCFFYRTKTDFIINRKARAPVQRHSQSFLQLHP